MGVACAAWACAALLAACSGDDTLTLEVTADDPARRLRVEVKGPAGEPPFLDEFDVDPANQSRDISDPAQAYQLAIAFAAPGRYGVHLMDVTATRPAQAWAGWFDVRGDTSGQAHLVRLESGADDDGDGWPETCPPATPSCAAVDCDDTDPSTNPFAVDVCADGIDQDCDGADRPCEDHDGDGVDERTDCDDDDAQVYPGQHEASTFCSGPEPRCDNGKDDDCAGGDAVCHTDADCDDYWPTSEVGGLDCDDANPAVHPGAIDACDDGIDQDCDGDPDDGCERCDEDGDGDYGQHPERGCTVDPAVADCDDADRGRFHGATADCGGLEGGAGCAGRGFCAQPAVDDDCDGEANDGCPSPACDVDQDGFASASCPVPPPAGAADCDDGDPTAYPGAPDRCGDGVLQNCAIDLPCTADGDGDGYGSSADCNDADNDIRPFGVELCNGVDDDCDDLIDEGNPATDSGTLDGVACNFDDDGTCAPVTGRCVCSPTLSDGILDPGGSRVACPGEAPGAAWGPRCFGAVQPTWEQCDLPDTNCDGRGDDPTGAALDPAVLGQPCHALPAPCVGGMVVGCDFSQSHPWYGNEYWVCSADEVGPEPEVCNGADDDCDAWTDEDFPVGTLCDGGDGDLCTEGAFECDAGGGVVCSDVTATNAEICNSWDDDCDGTTDEGYALGTACDGADTDLCTEGTTVCNAMGTGVVCNDTTGNTAELCNAIDDDCDGVNNEGFVLGMACDGPDTDLCTEGTTVCNSMGTATTCSDTSGNSNELCNGLDDDCDTMVDEGFVLGIPCDGPDTDLCVEGTTVCNMSGSGTTCTDATGSTAETCNGLDDDCNLSIDDGTAADTSCAPLGDNCSMASCLCGMSALCNPTLADNCAAGVCKCGTGAACNGMKTCVMGMCVN